MKLIFKPQLYLNINYIIKYELADYNISSGK